MKRGELYRVAHPGNDPKRFRVFVIVSRQALIDSRFSTVICAPIFSTYDGLASQVAVSTDQGLKHNSSIHCDELVSLPKSALTNYIGMLAPDKVEALDDAIQVALELPG
ncbi:MAG: type II toxin-antitoxin system PemK/MazF family toxin [Candidatus Electryonea clarkiae]|nr:type II toxin-antitoxin system PemK/MazF family toxin [Candidatus Electryonea clarkiae]MDP8288984.1 type II toxin-antitoxin system PemK/MazF family toxin [Candidatus Electryonea clarkiae]